MRIKFILSAILVFTSIFGYGSITITITYPTKNQYSDTSVYVQATVQSTYQIAAVIATSDNNSTNLMYNPTFSYFQGNCHLSGSPGDTIWLKVTASDVFGNQQSDSVRIIHPPTVPHFLVVEEPLQNSVARPGFRFKCTLNDPDTCLVEVRFYIPNPIETGRGYTIFMGKVKGFLDTTLYVHSSENGEFAGIYAIATNSKGEVSYGEGGSVYVETSPYLSEYYRGKDAICDFNYGKVVEFNTPRRGANLPPPTKLGDPPAIIDLVTHQKNVVPFDELPNGLTLTPLGVVFTGTKLVPVENYPEDTLYDFNAGNLLPVDTGHFSTISTKGNVLIWDRYPDWNLQRRNLITKQNEVIATTGQTSFGYTIVNDSAIVYGGGDSSLYIYSYRQGNLSQIHTEGGLGGVGIHDAEGDNVIYSKSYPAVDEHSVPLTSVYLYNGQTTTELSNDLITSNINPPGNYLWSVLTANYAGIYHSGGSGELQVWLRDLASGNENQVSFFGTSSLLEKLGENGDISFINPLPLGYYSKRYLAKRNSTPVLINRYNAEKMFYRNQEWYMAIGRMLYKIDLSLKLAVFKLLSFEAKATDTDNLLQWSVEGATDVRIFQIERSEDSLHFTLIDSLYPINSIYTTNYNFNDRYAQPVTNYYRLKIVNMDGSFVYSDVRSIQAVPFSLISFTATKSSTSNLLEWSAERSRALSQIEVERSGDNQSYSLLNTVTPLATNDSLGYQYEDIQPPAAINYYRLKFIKKDGTFEYSPVRSVDNTPLFTVIIYPNPAQDEVNISLPDLVGQTASVQLIDANGTIYQQFTVTSGSIKLDIRGLPPGTYYIRITASGTTQVIKILVL